MSSSSVIYLLLTASCLIVPTLCVNCYLKPDGVYEQSCRAYTKCVEGQTVIVNCQYNEAFNTKTKICENKWAVPPPCGTYRDCMDKNDGFYADTETKCGSYYTCSKGQFYGHTLCPGNLVYNEVMKVCDYKFNVPPPCGTLAVKPIVGSTASPTVGSTAGVVPTNETDPATAMSIVG